MSIQLVDDRKKDFAEKGLFDPSVGAHDARMSSAFRLLRRQCGLSIEDTRCALGGGGAQSKEPAATALRSLLKKYREARKSIPAPVDRRLTISRVLIADVAFTMLERCDHQPGPELAALLGELLEVDRHRADAAHVAMSKKDLAIWLEGNAPEMGVRELARAVGVSPSTIHTWRAEERYQQSVEDTMDTVEWIASGGWRE